MGRARPVTLYIAAFLAIHVATAPARDLDDGNAALDIVARSAGGASDLIPSAFGPATLPPLDSIDAQTDITVFLHSRVPAPIRVAALRRAWTTDPAIRDFRGLGENAWDFDDPNSIPGFGDLGPEIDVDQMVARILGVPVRLAALMLRRSDEPANSTSLAHAVRRLVFGTVHD
jgi:hypothetical protein